MAEFTPIAWKNVALLSFILFVMWTAAAVVSGWPFWAGLLVVAAMTLLPVVCRLIDNKIVRSLEDV